MFYQTTFATLAERRETEKQKISEKVQSIPANRNMMIIDSSPKFSRTGIMKAHTAAVAMPNTITLRLPARSESLPIRGCIKAPKRTIIPKAKPVMAELNP